MNPMSEWRWKMRSRMQYRVRRTRGWFVHLAAVLRHRPHPRYVWCGSYHCPHIPDAKP